MQQDVTKATFVYNNNDVYRRTEPLRPLRRRACLGAHASYFPYVCACKGPVFFMSYVDAWIQRFLLYVCRVQQSRRPFTQFVLSRRAISNSITMLTLDGKHDWCAVQRCARYSTAGKTTLRVPRLRVVTPAASARTPLPQKAKASCRP